MPTRCFSLPDLFTSGFAEAFWSNFLASLVVAALAFFVIEWRLQLKRARAARREVVHAVLALVQEELEHNRRRARQVVELVELESALPFPLFELNGWTFLSQANVFTALRPNTVTSLVHIYNRFRSANDVYDMYHDLMFGRTAVLAVIAGEALPDEAKRVEAEKFNALRDDYGRRLLERVRELAGTLNRAYIAVAKELTLEE